MQLGESVADQVGERDGVLVQDAAVVLTLVLDGDAARDHLSGRHVVEDGDLTRELGREPFVVVVTEGNELVFGREQPGVSCTRVPGSPPVGDHQQAAGLADAQ